MNSFFVKAVPTKRVGEKFTKYQHKKLHSFCLGNKYTTTKETRTPARELQLPIAQVQKGFENVRPKLPKDDINATVRGKEI